MSVFGKNISVEIFGESHGECIGVRIKNLKKGEKIDKNRLQAFLDLRAPGKMSFPHPVRKRIKWNLFRAWTYTVKQTEKL